MWSDCISNKCDMQDGKYNGKREAKQASHHLARAI
jgi:hypothetical protein